MKQHLKTPSPDVSSKDSGLWSPLSITLLWTPTSGLLVYCPATVNPTNELAQWIKCQLPIGSTLKYFFCTHTHGDPFLGLPILEEHFPELKAYAAKAVVEGIDQQYSPEIRDAVWASTFAASKDGSSLPSVGSDFNALVSSNQLDLEGHSLKLYDVPHGDTHANLFIHVHELDLVLAGDIVHNDDCHRWLGKASNAEK
ncbi:hypothetical protein FBULB1_11338 [Fusarium bulbicola]|nr:hypothetical protein FBULB1_11338 [Fusarium bulbicola]